MQEGINNLFAGAVFLAGVLSFFSPCVFPLLPVYLGKLAEDPGTRSFSFFGLKVYVSPLVKTVFFITGLSTVFFSLGFGTGFFSHIFYHPYTPYVMGGIVILLGLHQMELININFLQRQKKIELDGKRQGGILGAFLLGLTFSFGWTPQPKSEVLLPVDSLCRYISRKTADARKWLSLFRPQFTCI